MVSTTNIQLYTGIEKDNGALRSPHLPQTAGSPHANLTKEVNSAVTLSHNLQVMEKIQPDTIIQDPWVYDAAKALVRFYKPSSRYSSLDV